MYIQQLYTGCISEAAYYIESNGEAAIVDPLRDIDPYLLLAKERNTTIRYIFETHFHADFISGHLDLCKATGAPIVYGPDTQANFDVIVAADNQEFTLGNITIQVLHTPGHTLESTCYLVKNEGGKPYAIFTGDTLFVGDVGRPDLAQKGETLTTEDLAGMLYNSLQQKIMPLADDIIVYPAHGEGSSCGKHLGPHNYSTIGEEKKSNYALQPQTKEEFIKAITEGLAVPPQYFPLNAQINKEGYEALDALLEKGLTPLNVADFKTIIRQEDNILLDTRPTGLFTQGFVPGAINIGLEGRFAEWAGSLLPFDKSLVLITENGKEKETIVRLARVGFEKFKGYLEGGYEAWKEAGEPVDMIINVDADELAMDIPFDENLVIMDVRKEVEFADGHVKDAINIPLSNLTDPGSMASINDTDNLYLHCGSGYRSVIAASLLKRQGIHNLRNVNGGYTAIKNEQKIETEKSNEVLN
ncbi:MBL fold metallo-hydrolase [Ilyomonas limi]|uniref:MBL fold metallo-hydrolase n=1 Tax=Ilyomonas limi TaxID=2575867 RepID=A0A4V5UVC2_9BACT|nr:MBL fold metallo-hydrolase [Ilyomonas limi]TKK70883.1 MBL fold metallo-hydrolase [Ilyomonas limi]